MSSPLNQIKIDLMSAEESVIKDYLNKQEKKGNWIYLGKDIRTRDNIKEIFGEQYTLIMLGPKIQECARKCRQNYIDYIGHLGNIYGSDKDPCWWLTSISEKNPYISDVFLNLCYLKVCLEYIDEHPVDLIVVCESQALMHALQANLNTKTNLVRCHIKAAFVRTWKIKSGIRQIFHKCVFLMRYFSRIILSRLYKWTRRNRINDESSKVTVIYSWADERSFHEQNHYTDVYCGELGTDLKKKNIDSVYMLNVLPTINFCRALHVLLNVREKILLFEEFVGLSDLIRTLTIIGKIKRSIDKTPDFIGMKVNEIVNSAFQEDLLNARAEQALLLYYAVKRIADQLPISTFVYPFENHIHEKMFCHGLRSSSPKTILTGYAHSVVIPMYTSYSVSKYEKGIIPLPDRIIVNGKHPRDILVDSGFDRNQIFIAGGVRFANSGNQVHVRAENSRTISEILVTPTSGIPETLELVNKIISAFRDEPDVEIIIKPHPILPIERLRSALPKLPSHIKLEERPIDELLVSSSLLIYTESTASLEALARGIPALHVSSDVRIDMNPLEGCSLVPSVSQPDDIRENAKMLIGSNYEHMEEYMRIQSDFLEDLHENYTDLFLGKQDNEETVTHSKRE